MLSDIIYCLATNLLGAANAASLHSITQIKTIHLFCQLLDVQVVMLCHHNVLQLYIPYHAHVGLLDNY